MNKGTVNTRILKRSILKHIARTELVSIGVGTDYSVLEVEASRFAIIMAEGFSSLSGEMAFIRALNNLSMSGASAEKLSIDLLFGESCGEQRLRDEMERLVSLSKSRNLKIIGGNTVCSGQGETLSITVTVYGKVDIDCIQKLNQRLMPGDKVVALGETGHFGASLITKERFLEMKSRFAESYMKNSLMSEEDFFVEERAKKLISEGAKYVHDVSFGGIYRAIFEIAERAGKGIEIIHEKIPIRQDTIEVCEFWNINPYQLLGIGEIIAVFSPEDLDKISLEEYNVIGELKESGERIVISGNGCMKRSLTFYEGDEIYKVLGEV